MNKKLIRKMLTAAGGPLRIKFDPEKIARLEYLMTRVPGMNNSGGNRYREKGILALQHLELEAKRKEEEIKSRMEMRPTLKRKATKTEKLQGKKDEYEQIPLVVGISGADPLLGTLFDLYVGGKGLSALGKTTKYFFKNNKSLKGFNYNDLPTEKYTYNNKTGDWDISAPKKEWVLKGENDLVPDYFISPEEQQRLVASGLSPEEAAEIMQTRFTNSINARPGIFRNLGKNVYGESRVSEGYAQPVYNNRKGVKASLNDAKTTLNTVFHELGGHGSSLNGELSSFKLDNPLVKIMMHNEGLRPLLKPFYLAVKNGDFKLAEKLAPKDGSLKGAAGTYDFKELLKFIKYMEENLEYSARAIGTNMSNHYGMPNGWNEQLLREYFTKESVDNLLKNVWNYGVPVTTGGYNLYNLFNQPLQQLQYLKQGGKMNTLLKFKNGGYVRKMLTAAGGNLFSDKKDHSSRMITTGGAGYVPPTIDISKTKQNTNKRLYRTTSPLEANYSLLPALQNFLSNKEYDDTRDGINEEYPVGTVDAIWAKYLQVPEKDRRYSDRLEKSSYKPSKGSNSDNYYKLPLQDYEKESLVNATRKLPLYKNKVSKLLNNYALGEHTIGRGYDNHGEYASYFDVFNINPFNGKYGGINIPIVNKLDDIGIGKPVRIYDRIYLDDYYGVKEPTHATYLPEVIVTGKKKQGGKMNILEFLKNGSGIHIKKKNRGKFTSYCGGKVTDECIRKAKASGNPTLVKRATFAANARKWKHKEGGIIIKAADGTKTNLFLKVGNFLNSDLGKTVGTGLINAFSSWTSSNKLNDAIDSLIKGLEKRNKADINSIQNWAWQKATEEITLKFNELLLLFNSGASFEQPSPVFFEHLELQLANKYAQKAINDANLNSQEAIANLESLKTNPISDTFSSLVNTGMDYLSNKFANKALSKNGVPSSRNASFYSNPYLKTLNKAGTINSNGSMNTGIGGLTYNWKTNTFGSNNMMNSFDKIKF